MAQQLGPAANGSAKAAGQCLALDQLHRVPGGIGFGAALFQDADHSWMADLAEGVDLPAKRQERLGRGEADGLDRHLRATALVHGAVDNTHRPPPERGEHAVGPQMARVREVGLHAFVDEGSFRQEARSELRHGRGTFGARPGPFLRHQPGGGGEQVHAWLARRRVPLEQHDLAVWQVPRQEANKNILGRASLRLHHVAQAASLRSTLETHRPSDTCVCAASIADVSVGQKVKRGEAGWSLIGAGLTRARGVSGSRSTSTGRRRAPRA